MMSLTDGFGNPLPPSLGDDNEEGWGQAVAGQIVAGYDDASDRDAGETSPVTGRLIFLRDAGLLQAWDGAAWMYLPAVKLLETQLAVNMGSMSADTTLSKAITIPAAITTSGARFLTLHGATANQFTYRSSFAYEAISGTSVTIRANGGSNISGSGTCYVDVRTWEILSGDPV